MSTPGSRPSCEGWSALTTMRAESTCSTTPSRRATTVTPESRATTRSMPVPTSGASVRRSGTAWRCMLEPMRARLASSFSRNGISDAATDTSWFGDTSMNSTLSGVTMVNSPPMRDESGEAALVSDLGERVRLVHELRELGGPEELLDNRRHWLVVDQLLRHQRLDVLQAHALLDGALHAHETDAVLVLDQLADGAHATVAQVVDVVDLAVAVLELDQVADDLQDVLAPERPLVEGDVQLELVVQLQAPDAREVVALGVEEEVVEEGGGRLRGGRVARAEPAVDLEDRVLGLLDLVLEEGVAERGADVGVVEEEDLHLVDAALAEELELLVGDLLVGREHDLARPRVLDVVRRDPAEHLLEGDGNLLDAGLLHLSERRPGELAALLDDPLVALRVAEVPGRLHAHQVIGHEALRGLAAVEDDGVLAVVVVADVLGGRPA